MSTAAAETITANDYFAIQVRSLLGSTATSFTKFAEQLQVPKQWTGRRLSVNASVALTLNDAQLIADGLGVPLVDLLPPSP